MSLIESSTYVENKWPPSEYYSAVGVRISKYLKEGKGLSIRDGGGVISELEGEYMSLTGAQYAVALNSGTSALFSAFLALGLKEGDEVIVPAYTFHASVTPLIHLRAAPVLCDVDANTGNISVSDVEQKITARTKGLVVTHIYGNPADMTALLKICKENNIWVLEDCSHAHGANIEGKSVGVWGDIGVFSLQEAKLAPAGEGGVIVTNNHMLYEKCVFVSQFGDRLKNLEDEDLRRFHETGLGLKFRMHPLAAIAGLEGLLLNRKYGGIRADNAKYLASALKRRGVRALIFDDKEGRVHFAFRLRLERSVNRLNLKSDVIDMATSLGVDLHNPSLPPLISDPLFSNKPKAFEDKFIDWPVIDKRKFVGTNDYYNSLLAMPLFWHLEHRNEIDIYVSSIRKLQDALFRSIDASRSQ